ncbi:MAG: hypothetical protein V1775_18975 [Bacteroidota bacterium]
MTINRDSLSKLVVFIEEVANKEGFEWFRKDIASKLKLDIRIGDSTTIDEIYEYCIQLIIKEQAERFYEDFKLIDIKEKLLEDFIRMEKFRREDKFEDFCLALFQQIEGIVNRIISEEKREYLLQHKEEITHKIKDKTTSQNQPQKMWQLFFYPHLDYNEVNKKLLKPIADWDFTERYKVVLYFYYFNKKIYDYYDFYSLFSIGNDLYQMRNLNHRGGKTTDRQKETIARVTSSSYKYYFKFLGFLEDFTSKVNLNI